MDGNQLFDLHINFNDKRLSNGVRRARTTLYLIPYTYDFEHVLCKNYSCGCRRKTNGVAGGNDRWTVERNRINRARYYRIG